MHSMYLNHADNPGFIIWIVVFVFLGLCLDCPVF